VNNFDPLLMQIMITLCNKIVNIRKAIEIRSPGKIFFFLISFTLTFDNIYFFTSYINTLFNN